MMLLLPVYRPGRHLPELIAEVRHAEPGMRVVVVDDGSEDTRIVDGLTGCTVLKHQENRGKGVALRTGLAAAGDDDVVCADADGQHSAVDIARVADRLRETGRLVLGVRRFGPETPLRSRVGNTVTQALFRAVTGRSIMDTQTGLRGFPVSMLSRLRAIPGEGFEYEMNVLLDAAGSGRPIEQVEIATTYLNGNSSSHFDPIGDAARVYLPLLRFATAGRRFS